MQLQDIKLYRMTHIDNIPHILSNGITHRSSQNANPNYINIGDLSLIDNRTTKAVRINNGNILNIFSPSLVLGDCIPFYFGIKMPMLYVIQNGGNFVQKATNPQDIIYVVCSLKSISTTHKDFFFSDGHATDNLTSFYDSSKTADLPSIIDWNAIRASFWGGEENLNIKRKKQAEFLVLKDVEVDHIVGYGCFNEAAKQNLLNLRISENRIKVIPYAYY